MPSPPHEAVPLSTVFFKLVPFLGAISLNLFKLAADNRFLTLRDSNDLALDLVVISLVAMVTLLPGKGEDVYTAIATINLLAIGILLVLRGVGRRQRAKFRKGVSLLLGLISGVDLSCCSVFLLHSAQLVFSGGKPWTFTASST